MSNNLATRLRRVEAKLKPERLVVFHVRDGHEEEDFEPQYEEFIEKGGDPDSVFVSIIDYGEKDGVTNGDEK